ncbi:MAG: PilX N-terminal domain-containing pilus assembly protein [Burkholderiaceae bacterium]
MKARHPPRRLARPQRGFALIVGLLMLLAITMLAIGMFRSTGLQEKIAGNTREKERALGAAQSALQYGEWWLLQGDRGMGTSCSALGVVSANSSAMQVCSDVLADPNTLPWSNRADYAVPGMATGAGAYVAVPGVYVQYKGMTPAGTEAVYEVTAFGYGGRGTTAAAVGTTAAVVRSTFKVGSGVKDLSGGN